jgi:3-phosphoshikimate 1-carboxyvinyltransferase
MSFLEIEPSSLTGKVRVPPSKSHTLRAILFAAMGTRESRVRNPLSSPDTLSMIAAVEQFGAKVNEDGADFVIQGVGKNLLHSDKIIDAGNSGIVFRFMSAIASLSSGYTVVSGDPSIRNQRPSLPLLQGLRGLGAFAESILKNDKAPIVIKGPIQSGKTHLDGQDSQPVSALLIAAGFLEGLTEITVDQPGEKPWIDLTLHWMNKLNIDVENRNYEHYLVRGGAEYEGFDFNVPGDFSSAAFPLAAAIATNSEVSIEGIDKNDIQGDKHLVDVLQSMGANIDWQPGELCVKKGKRLIGREIDVNPIIDALPILAVLGCFAQGTTRLFNGSIARQKECDRIHSICSELKKMGADIEETPDGLIIRESSLSGTNVESRSDHRIAMSLSVAALGAKGKTRIDSIQCIQKTFPGFIPAFQAIGAAFKR